MAERHTDRRVDRRVQRTRQVLQQAFLEVLREKGFAATNNPITPKGFAPTNLLGVEKGFLATSIQDITERANVNRGTFYLHFSDKYMLLETVIRERFRQSLESYVSLTFRWDRNSLQLLIRQILTGFEEKYQHRFHPSHILAPLIERAMHEELADLLLSWLRQTEHAELAGQYRSHRTYPGTQRPVSLETIARVTSWAIFGTAIQWSQEETTLSAEEMARDILLVTLEGIAHLAPDALPE